MITPTFAQQVSMASSKALEHKEEHKEHKEQKRLSVSVADNVRISPTAAPEKNGGPVVTAAVTQPDGHCALLDNNEKNSKTDNSRAEKGSMTTGEEDVFRDFLHSHF